MNVVRTVVDWFKRWGGENDRNAEAETAGASGAAYDATVSTTPNPVTYSRKQQTIYDPDL